jgi:hypothetical protein
MADPAQAPPVRAALEELARFGIWAGLLALTGVILSGPVALAVVQAAGAQPDWVNAETFVAGYRSIQTIPYVLGIALIAGCVTMVLTLARMPGISSLRADLARVLATVFAGMILFNYVIQTTFVPAQVGLQEPGALAAFTMSNPSSLAWSLEMWGYALLGVALWLVAPAFHDTRLERITGRLISVNALLSLAGGVATSVRQEWVVTDVGLVSFAAWNVLLAAIALCFALSWRARLRLAVSTRADVRLTEVPS